MEIEGDRLDLLLSVATAELETINSGNSKTQETLELAGSLVHEGETDSSEDESKRNFETKYNECGKEIKELLKEKTENKLHFLERKTETKDKPQYSSKTVTPSSTLQSTSSVKYDVYYDPIFGIRIVNPLISSAVLKSRMIGRDAITFSKLLSFFQNKSPEQDWVLGAVIVNRSSVKTTQNGKKFVIWTLSDLKDDIKTVTMFLFGSAYSDLWKTVVGTVVGILNPNVLDKRSGSKDLASLSIDDPQRVMILGISKDFGTCKSTKKNGEKCTAIVNLSRCEFCIYHVKREYQKCSRRSELQSSFVGRGLTALRNKVLGKNEVFYAGKSYTAIPAKRNKKLEMKDNETLMSLNNGNVGGKKTKQQSGSRRKQNAARLEVSQAQRLKDLKILRLLGSSDEIEKKTDFVNEPSSNVTLETSKNIALDVINKLKAKKDELTAERTSDENETEFLKVHSSNVTLETSKNTALDVIQKLKARKNQLASDESKSEINSNNKSSQDESKAVNSQVRDSNLSTSLSECNSIKAKISDSLSYEKNKEFSDKPNFVHSCSSSPSNKPNLDNVPNFLKKVPKLSTFTTIDLGKSTNKAKLNAIKYVKEKGQIKKLNPNDIKSSSKKRPHATVENEPMAKKSKLQESEFISDRFKKMMAATSRHVGLLQAHDEEELEKYYNKQERKEQMEEKMAKTYKVSCKAVRCLQCKYTSFSASDFCKQEKHPLKVFDAVKRFFKCVDCRHRTVTLEMFPRIPCNTCGAQNWERTGMIEERIVTNSHQLSIRGGEQKFVNSDIAGGNIDLLVPEN